MYGVQSSAGLKMSINAHIVPEILTSKVGQGDLVFGL